MSEHRVKPETTKLHPALTTREDSTTRMTCFNDDFTPCDVHFICLFQLEDLLRYNDIVLFMRRTITRNAIYLFLSNW